MLTVYCGNTATTAITWFIHVFVSGGCSSVEVDVFQWFLPGFGNGEKVYVVVGYKFTEYWSFFI